MRGRLDHRVILHFDYDAYYCQVVESDDPSLKGKPLAIQQKQIVATCNYEARHQGLRKLQLISTAKAACPDLVIVSGEDLTKFRDVSKELYNFIRSYSWNGKAERLGFDEVFLDVSDMIDYNVDLLNSNNLNRSFFCLSKVDPTLGFHYDATEIAGHTFGNPPETSSLSAAGEEDLQVRLRLGSHLAQYLRNQLEEQKGYIASVGISTSKLLSKLVSNLNKPRGQTTLIPPYTTSDQDPGNVINFLDGHEIRKIPGIGFKMAHVLREFYLQRPEEVEGWTSKDSVTVRDLRVMPGMNSAVLEKALAGPGNLTGIGSLVWNLLHGIDDAEVARARDIPRQISIEDSYVRLDSYDEVTRELRKLSKSLINRMRIDLIETTEVEQASDRQVRWLAQPKTLRLSTRPRLPANADRNGPRTWTRISRTTIVPTFLYGLNDSIDIQAERLVDEYLLPLFQKLHPEKSGWDLSLVNVAVANMVESGSDSRTAAGRNISKMFQQQEEILKEWKVEDRDVPPDDFMETDFAESLDTTPMNHETTGSEDFVRPSQETVSSIESDRWQVDHAGAFLTDSIICTICGAYMPPFAITAHERFHELGD